MKIFIGSSSEQSEVMEKVSDWLKACGHHPLQWNDAIHLGKDTLINQLIGISRKVDGAIFIFAEDDVIEVRGKGRRQPRDNVLFEYGLFMGTLGTENVVFVRVGKAKIATDLLGVVYVDLPIPRLVKKSSSGVETDEEISEKDVRATIETWAAGLAPFYLKGLGIDLAEHLVKTLAEGKPVANILCNEAPRLVAGNASSQIRALCSDKGDYSEKYYGPQFDWVRERNDRSIKRVFVRSRGDSFGFSAGETMGINMHLDEKLNGVSIRWIFADNRWLGGPYSNSLGFAIFGKSWIMHWGLKLGAFHDDRKQGQNPSDHGVLELLDKRFMDLWEHSTEFECSLIADIRQNVSEIKS